MNKLHIITNRISTAITQQPSLKKNIIKDFKFLFYRHNRVILFLVKHFPNNSFFRWIIKLNTEICLYYYFRFLSVRLNRLKNKLLANYLRNRGNDLATVRNSAFCVAILSNNSFICKYNIFFRKYELSVAIL